MKLAPGLSEVARPFIYGLVRLSIFNIAAALIALVLPWVGGRLLGQIVGGNTASRPDFGWLLLALLAMTAANVAAALVAARVGPEVLTGLRQRLFEKVQTLPISFHDAQAKGDLMALMTYEVMTVAQFLTGTVAATPARILTVVGAVTMMFVINPRLALIVPVLVPAFYLIVKLVGRQLYGLARESQRAEAEIYALSELALELLPATKAFTREKFEADRFRRATAQSAALSLRQGRLRAFIDPAIFFVAAVAVMIIIILAGEGLRDQTLGAGEAFGFLFYAALLTRPVSALAHLYGEYQVARATLPRLRLVLDSPAETVGEPVSGTRLPAAIKIENLRFAFPGRPPLFDGLNLDIAPGERLALSGPNGSGKSALIHLLLHYYQPDGGRILVDGRDCVAMDLGELRSHFGLVPQVPLLFDGSVRDNIAYGAEDSGDVQVEAAARLAQAHDFIAALPQGYATQIGNRGVRLSGGQRQRIALARALIKNPPVLILDEATSMFDFAGEEAFIADCDLALAGRTVILVTHRPALLKLATRRVEMVSGRIVERSGSRRQRARA